MTPPSLTNPNQKREGETLDTIRQWCEETFGPISTSRIVERAGEEFEELRAEPDNVTEAADVVICLSRFPGLWAEVERKMKINRGRRWRLMGDGTGYHIKDGSAASAAPAASVPASARPSPGDPVRAAKPEAECIFGDFDEANYKPDLGSAIAAEVMGLKWTHAPATGDDDGDGEQMNRFGDVQEAVGRVLEAARTRTHEVLVLQPAVLSVSTPTGEGEVLRAASEWRRARLAACAAPIGTPSVWAELGSAETSLSEAVNAALAHPQQGGEREGWKLMPPNTTVEMEEAACCAADNGKFSGQYLRNIYRALLDAAPTSAPKSSGEEA